MNLVIIGGVVIAGVLSVFGVSKADKEQVLVSPIVVVVPTMTITPTATATPTLTTTPKKIKATPTPKPTPTAEPTENVNKLVDKISAEYGLDVNVVRHLGLCESGFRSNATNGKYVGLFQYDERTWRTVRSEMKLDPDPTLRYSAEEAIKTTAYAMSKGKTRLWPNCIP